MTPNKQKEIENFFKGADSKIHPYIKSVNWKEWLNPAKNETEHFIFLCNAVISQQLGTKSARAIKARFNALFPNNTPTPKLVLKLKPEQIKEKAKTSLGKATYIVNIAMAVKSGELDLKNIHKFTEEKARNQLTNIKGVGDWTADMFIMFSLGRENLYSFGDYGLKKGIMKVYGYSDIPNEKTISKITQKWEPYKTYGSIALWQSLET